MKLTNNKQPKKILILFLIILGMAFVGSITQAQTSNQETIVAPINTPWTSDFSNTLSEQFAFMSVEDNMTTVEKRTKGIWTNLFQFPLIETTKRIEEKQLFEMDLFNTLFNSLNISVKVFNNDLIVHKLSHQHIFTTFWIIKTPQTEKFSINWNTIEQFPVPVLIDNFLMQYKSN